MTKIKLSPETKREPTQTKTLQREYTKALTRLFRRFKELAIEALIHARITNVSGDKNSIDLTWFDGRIRDIALSTIILPGRRIVTEQVTRSYRSGLKYAGIALKRTGWIKTIDNTPDLIIMKNDRQVMDNLIAANQSDLRGISDETIKQIIQGLTAILKRSRQAEVYVRSLQTEQDMTGVISDTVDAVGITRADALGTTGTITAFSTAEEREYARNGVDSVVWITAQDDKTCSICSPLDGEVFTMDESFEPPPLHIHCRCTFIPMGTE